MLRVTNVCSKLAWVVSLKNKKSLTILNAFHKILNSSKGMQKKKKKKKKKMGRQRSDFYNRSIKS